MPAPISAAMARSSSVTPEVIRFVYMPSDTAWRTSSTWSRRAIGSPPVKCICSTPSAAAWSITRFHAAVSSSAAAGSSANGLLQ